MLHGFINMFYSIDLKCIKKYFESKVQLCKDN